MKKSVSIIFLVTFFCAFKCISDTEKTKTIYDNSIEKRLISHVKELQVLTTKNSKYNDKIGFFVDMKIPSGKNRFFVYDLKENKIIDQGLVAHGSGSETGIEGKLKFSNVNNSLSTSLGKYSIGLSYSGQFGKAYKLFGLDKTNSNAYSRNIVLHKYSKVPYDEQVESICNSYGCPMVNEKYFKRIEKIIDNSEKNIILEIYY
jgi:hypothetical protein